MRRFILAALILGVPAPALAQSVADIRFSVDPASPSIGAALTPTLTPDDILKAGPLMVDREGTTLGLTDTFGIGVFDNLDVLSNGRDPITKNLFFSVDRVAVGLAGTAVFGEAAPAVASAAGDIFFSPGTGGNSVFLQELALGLTPGFFGDDLDALEFEPLDPEFTYFSIDALSSSVSLAIRPGDIFRKNLGTKFAGFSTMGLDTADDLDALVLFDVTPDGMGGFLPTPDGVLNKFDRALFSLSTFSPSTFTGNPTAGTTYAAGVKGRLSPSDVLFTDFTGGFSLFLSAAQLGLRDDDNVDALATTPEPTSLVLAMIGAASLLVWRRKNRRIREFCSARFWAGS